MIVKTKYLIFVICFCLLSCVKKEVVYQPGIPSTKYKDYNTPYYPSTRHRYQYYYPYDYYNNNYYDAYDRGIDDQYRVPIRQYDENLDSNRDRAIN